MRRWLILPLALVAGTTALFAQRASDPPLVVSGEAMSFGEAQRALMQANRQANDARIRSDRLETEAQGALRDADRAQAQAAALAARIQGSEATIRAAEARVAIVDRLQRVQAARLATKQGPIVRLTAALQLLNRQPAAVALIQPGSIADAVHLRSVLDAVLPVVHQRTADIRAELHRVRQLRGAAQMAVKALRDGRAQLAEQRAAMARLEAERRLASREYRSNAGFESQRALAMGEEARDIVDLMDQLRTAGDVRARLEALPGPSLRPDDAAAPIAAPAIASARGQGRPARRPPYRLPVLGTLVTGMGEVSDSGVRARGLTIAAEAGAQVVAPTNGRVVFAGPYRGYGLIVIIDHGEGWTSLITNMGRLSATVGQIVRQGDPIGVAGSGTAAVRPKLTIELRRNGRPIDIVALTGTG